VTAHRHAGSVLHYPPYTHLSSCLCFDRFHYEAATAFSANQSLLSWYAHSLRNPTAMPGLHNVAAVQIPPAVTGTGVQRPGCTTNHSPPSSTEIKNDWSCDSIHPHAFMPCTGTTVQSHSACNGQPCIRRVVLLCV
jgi:hypothetical protein